MITQEQFSDAVEAIRVTPLGGRDGCYRITLNGSSVDVDGFTGNSHDEDTTSTWYRSDGIRDWTRVDDNRAIAEIIEALITAESDRLETELLP